MVRARNVLGAIVRLIREKLTVFWMVNIDIPHVCLGRDFSRA